MRIEIKRSSYLYNAFVVTFEAIDLDDIRFECHRFKIDEMEASKVAESKGINLYSAVLECAIEAYAEWNPKHEDKER